MLKCSYRRSDPIFNIPKSWRTWNPYCFETAERQHVCMFKNASWLYAVKWGENPIDPHSSTSLWCRDAPLSLRFVVTFKIKNQYVQNSNIQKLLRGLVLYQYKKDLKRLFVPLSLSLCISTKLLKGRQSSMHLQTLIL